MTVYGELLLMAVDADRKGRELTLGELVAVALGRRAWLSDTGIEVAADRRGRTPLATRIEVALAYDAALVRLCERLGVAHDLTGPMAGPAARRAAEEILADRLPSLADALALSVPSATRHVERVLDDA